MLKSTIISLIILIAVPSFAGNLIDAGQHLIGLSQPSVAWADYDKDGDLDLAICGKDNTDTPLTKIYINDKCLFVEDKRQKLEGVSYGKIGWADYDNDGNLDLTIAGYNSSRQPISKIYRNDNGIFIEDTEQHPPVRYGSIAWADSDNDGKQDIYAHAGNDENWVPYTKVFKKKEDGTVEEIKQDLAPIYYGSVGWGDYNNDKRLDLLVTGWTPEGGLIKIYKNIDGTLVQDTKQDVPPVFHSSVDFGDYNNDGFVDLVIAGQNGNQVIAKIFRNDNGIFKEEIAPVMQLSDENQSLLGVNFCAVSWCDYDQDGDLDLLLVGADKDKTPIAKVFNNNLKSSQLIHKLEIVDLQKITPLAEGKINKGFIIGTSLVVAARGCDAQGNIIKYSPVCWQISGDIGTLSRNNGITTEINFTKIGTGTLIVYDQQGHTATLTLKIGGGIVNSVRIEDLEGNKVGSLTVLPHRTVTLYARGYDMDGNLIRDAMGRWTVNGNIGTLSTSTGTTCVFIASGFGTGTISLEVDGTYTDTTGIIVIAPRIAAAPLLTTAGKQSLDTIIVYPNPVSPPNEMWFKGIQQRKINIQIFNIAGELVRELNDNELNRKGELDSTESAKWDVKNSAGRIVASGIYIYLIRDIETDEKHIGKLAIVR